MSLSRLPSATASASRATAGPAPRMGFRLAGPGPRAAQGSGFLHYAMLAYLFLFCSRFSEFIPEIPISAVLLLILLLAMGLTMRGGTILKMPSGKALIALTVWVGLCVPFSVWIGGSATVFRGAVQSVLTVAVMAAFITTVPDVIRAMFTVGAAMTTAAALSFAFGATSGGRLEIALEGSTLSDPNFYCYYVLTGLPFIVLAAFLSGGVKRLGWVLMTLPVLYVVAKSGSRGGMLGFVAGLLFFFWFSTFKQKAYLTLLLMIGIPIAAAVLPPTTIKRFISLSEGAELDDVEALVAKQSADSRKYLFFRSLELTVKNPLVGVGPGQFVTAEASDAEAKGIRPGWHVSHNTYTQFSSETGILGLVLFLMAVGGAYIGLNPLRKRNPDKRIRIAALMTQTSIVIVCVCGAFLSLGYSGLHYAVIGLAGTFQAAVRNSQNATGNPVRLP